MEAALTALLASVAGGRRYWGRKPQTDPARPYVVMSRISGQRSYTYAAPANYVQSRVQIDAYAETYTAARDTAEAIVVALSGYSGGIIRGIFIDGQRDLSAADAGEVTTLFRVSIDAFVHHKEN